MRLSSITKTLDGPRATGWHRPARVLGLLLLAGAELLGLSLRFDTASLAASPAAWARVLDYAPQALMAALAALAVLGLVLAPRRRERLRALAGPAPDDRWRRALGLHLVLLVGFTRLSPRVLEPSADTSGVENSGGARSGGWTCSEKVDTARLPSWSETEKATW